MLRPRITILNGKERLVLEDQMVGYKELMTQNHRVLFFTGAISETSSIDLLMTLDTISHDPIKLVITSPGGDIDTTFLFYDIMKMLQSPVITIGRYCASAAAILLAAGKKRYLLPHGRVMLHLAVSQMAGDVKDYEIQHKQMESYQNKIIDILQDCGVKKNREEIMKDIDRDFWLEPQEAIDYGLCDEILTPDKWKEMIGE